jgi:uncharacterized protein YxeA
MKAALLFTLIAVIVVAIGAGSGYVKNQYDEFEAGIYLEGAKDGAVLGYKAGREDALKEGLCL